MQTSKYLRTVLTPIQNSWWLPAVRFTGDERKEMFEDTQLVSHKKPKKAANGSTSQSVNRPALGAQPAALFLTAGPTTHSSAAAAIAEKFLIEYPAAAALLSASTRLASVVHGGSAQLQPHTISNPGPTTSIFVGMALTGEDSAALGGLQPHSNDMVPQVCVSMLSNLSAIPCMHQMIKFVCAQLVPVLRWN